MARSLVQTGVIGMLRRIGEAFPVIARNLGHDFHLVPPQAAPVLPANEPRRSLVMAAAGGIRHRPADVVQERRGFQQLPIATGQPMPLLKLIEKLQCQPGDVPGVRRLGLIPRQQRGGFGRENAIERHGVGIIDPGWRAKGAPAVVRGATPALRGL